MPRAAGDVQRARTSKAKPQSAVLFDDEAYEVLAVLNASDRLAFLNHYFWKVPSVITAAHHAFSVLVLIAAALSGSSRGFGFAAWAGTAAAALIFAMILVPVHEVIHAGAYKALGATDIRWTLSVRNHLASVTAHRFVISRREAMIVAALPWCVMTTLLGLAVVGLAALRPFLLITLLIHHVGSRGDWAYLSYFWRCRGREVYVLEDADLEQCWFCVARDR